MIKEKIQTSYPKKQTLIMFYELGFYIQLFFSQRKKKVGKHHESSKYAILCIFKTSVVYIVLKLDKTLRKCWKKTYLAQIMVKF